MDKTTGFFRVFPQNKVFDKTYPKVWHTCHLNFAMSIVTYKPKTFPTMRKSSYSSEDGSIFTADMR